MPGERRGHRGARVMIRGVLWQLREFGGDSPPGEPGKLYGLCDYERRIIWVSASHRTARGRVDTVAHEVLHAALPDLAEETVAETAEAIALALEAFCGTGGSVGRAKPRKA